MITIMTEPAVSGTNKKEQENGKERSLKENRIRAIAISYYSRQDIRRAIFEFAKNRECAPRYFEHFGKRPDTFQYESDIFELAKKGATSFHCSEELWFDPLEISTELSEEELKKNRLGWDFLIDVDSKYLDYSKIYAEIIIEVLRQHGIKNLGVKFSGSKGFHIIIPWKAFPEEISGKQTREMFPEWPRLICQYLNSKVSEKLREKVLDISESTHQKELLEVYCAKCNSLSEKKVLLTFVCPSCKTELQNIQAPVSEISKGNYENKDIRCPNCQKKLEKSRSEEIYVCAKCNLNSKKQPANFKERIQSRHIDADIVLVSPRHLFRAPYSLHEKTSLASVVIDPDKIKEFEPKEADPLRVLPKNFLPDSEPGEATMLLRAALEYKPPKDEKKVVGESKNFEPIIIKNFSSELYPPSIKTILRGMKADGRKRALFILLNFFKSLKLPDEEIARQIDEWNKKNYKPLEQGYIKSQLAWYSKQKDIKLPPNFDKPYYRDIGIIPTPEELETKNPVNYVRKKSFSFNRSNKN